MADSYRQDSQQPVEYAWILLQRFFGKAIRSLKGTEWITDKPYRGNRITYAYSTTCDATYRKLFGKPMESAHEYAADDGKPLWQKHYKLRDLPRE